MVPIAFAVLQPDPTLGLLPGEVLQVYHNRMVVGDRIFPVNSGYVLGLLTDSVITPLCPADHERLLGRSAAKSP